MTADPVNGGGNGARSGAQTLVLLAAPLTSRILHELSQGPKQQGDLRSAAGLPAQTTLRAQLGRLTEIGAVEKHRRNRFPGVLEYELTSTGWGLFSVGMRLESWLSEAPGGPLTLGENPAKAAVKGLAEAWSTTMLRALAARPLSLTELDGVITGLSYPSLERRLAAIRLAGLIKPARSEGRGTPYDVTKWLRRGVGPLALAARWERTHLPDSTAPMDRLDVEAAFLLTVPLLRLPTKLSGRCRMAVEVSNGPRRRLAGVVVELEEGAVMSCTTQIHGDAGAWALGPPAAWLEAVIEHKSGDLTLGGRSSLALAMVSGLHRALFADSTPNRVST